MSGALLQAKNILVTGVRTPRSIAFPIAREAQLAGALILLVARGRSRALAERSARRLPRPVAVLEFDVSDDQQVGALRAELERRWGAIDGLVHSIAFAPPDALGGNFLATPYASAASAFESSAYSLARLVARLRPLLEARGASVVTMDFDASVAWPAYDWMGVAKASLEAVVRYLARDLGAAGVRVNAIAAGPLRTLAAKGIPGFEAMARHWRAQAPLG